ncbi:hypothetical protein Csa_020603 [Cucumis sativus]|uniref:Uncharacterized protein n=1 Tax=Cucumis sativus TaxID=3659 RepID=A0A0A0KC38_CUCSA|nr:hypothetical protein Csa_020603 [Cucumis sativus]
MSTRMSQKVCWDTFDDAATANDGENFPSVRVSTLQRPSVTPRHRRFFATLRRRKLPRCDIVVSSVRLPLIVT